MNPLALLLALLPTLAQAEPTPQAAPPEPPGAPQLLVPPPLPPEALPPVLPAVPRGAEACGEDAWEDDATADAEVLGALRLSINGQTHALASLEFEGLVHLPEARVRALAGLADAGALTAEQAGRVLRRLERTGLFARMTPTVRLAEGAAPVLKVRVEEQPYLTGVDIQGVHEEERDDVARALFERPSFDWDGDAGAEGGVLARVRVEGGDVQWDVVAQRCPRPVLPRGLFASYQGERFHAGFVWKGLPEALERAVEALRDEGYLLASLEATLTPEGRLEVRVEEGRVSAVEVEGAGEGVVERVRSAVGIKPGDVLLRSDLRRAEKRLKEELPFLSLDEVETRPVAHPRFREERAEGGARHYRPVVEERSRERSRSHPDGKRNAIATEGTRVVVHVRPRGPSIDGQLIPQHTQVTGLAPGVGGSLTLWDAQDRVHPVLDGALVIPLRLGGQRIPGEPEQTARQRRLDWRVGAGLQVPALGLAEVGVQVHDTTDTFDRWRIGAIDSFISSALLNRPDAEYFRRTGYTGFATWRLGTNWLLGGEYRRDTYASLASLSPPFSLFRRDSASFPNPAVDEGRMSSVVGRLEYASDARRADKVGSLWRAPELSLFHDAGTWPSRLTLRGLFTVEVGSPALGGEAAYRFWKVVGDGVLYVSTGRNEGLRLRVRAAGGENLPLQKQEALGGWGALRGYGFKEFRGDASLLTSAEYRFGFLGAFADVGTVHSAAGWSEPRLGAGLQLYLGDSAHVSVAWRTDERATLVPEARLFFTRPF